MDVPEGSTDLVTLDSSVRLHMVPEDLTHTLACLEMHLFNRNKLAMSSLGVVGAMQGTRSEKSLGNAKTPTISRILALEQSWYGKGNFAGVVEQDVDSERRSRRDCSGGCAGAVERGESCCGKRKRLTSVARLGVNKGEGAANTYNKSFVYQLKV